uniref:MADF domain-containing protein n=1 Tax=Globodera rostochiensis TaxID=31243 RepID=A0A914GWZ4_GLORO
MLDEASVSREIGSNETAAMINADEHELDTDPGIQGSDNDATSSMQRQLSAAAVKQSHCLYDASDRQYRSADYKIKVWNRLVHVLSFQGDARTLYNRWKQLRDKYGKEKKKLKYSGEQQSQWQYFKHLEFLDPHMVDRTQQRFERNKDGKVEQRQIIITDPNFAAHLINEVRLQHCLYDIKDPKYRHTEYRNQAWAEIAKNLAFPGDVSALYKQWKKIRDRYVREKRKLRMTNGGEHEEPNWELYRELMWIDRYLDERAAQVKRKRESSELSGDEGLFTEDPYSSTLNSSGRSTTNQTIIGHQLQQLVKLQPQQQIGSTTVLQNPARGRVSGGGAMLGGGSVGLNASTASGGANTALMMPIQPQQQQLHHQLGQGPHQGGTQHVIITNEPTAIDGDRAFAISVAADLICLPEHARTMARSSV